MNAAAALFSHYRRHPLQLGALALMILIATMLWSGMDQLTDQARSSLGRAEQSLSEGSRVIREDGAPLTVADFARLRRAGLCVMPWLEVPDPDGVGRLIGIDPLAAACFASGSQSGEQPALDGEPFIDISRAARLAGAQGDGAGSLVLLAADSVSADRLPAGYALAPFARGPDTGELGASFLLNLDALGALVLLITALLLRAVYQLSIVQRRDSFALLHRFGVPGGRINGLLMIEVLVLAGVCVLPGVWAGAQLARALGEGFGRSLEGLFDVTLYADGSQWWRPILVMMVVVLIACLPTRTRRHWLQRSRGVGWLALALLAIGMVWVAGSPGLVWTFVAVGLVFVGAGVLVPRLMAGIMAALSSGVDDPLGRWRYRELGVMARQLALPVVALQFTLALVLAVQALVTTFEATFEQWLDQRLAAHWYVQVPEGRSGDRAEDWLAHQLASDTVAWHRIRRGTVMVAKGAGSSHRVDLLAVSPVGPLMKQWTLQSSLADPWQRLAGSQGVLINEQLALRYGVGVGDSLALNLNGRTQSRTVLGVYADYGRPSGEVLVNGADLPADFQPEFESFSISPGGRGKAWLVSGLQQIWQVPEIEIRENSDIRAMATRVFRQTFVLTRAMTFLTLTLAGTALLIMGWVFITSRAWYLQLLVTWGLSRREALGELMRVSLGLTTTVSLLALPLGVWLTWVLVHRINPQAFGWSLPMAVYPGFWLELLALSTVIGLGIAALMGRQLRPGRMVALPANQSGGGER